MKRLGLTLVAALCLSAAAFAAGNRPVEDNWYNNINVDKLSQYLNLTADQHQEVTNICDYFGQQMSQAARSKKNQEKLLRKAVYSNLKLMKQTLNDKQYTDYTRVLNITLNNKGIEIK
ncbi:MAG: hypothetical protein LUC23_01925 [Prevotellaceae bacterium]|nr:hypothetical protein [Prevotellaceae bacterium]